MDQNTSSSFPAVLQSFMDKISLIEEKANYAKNLVEKTALLSLLKLETKELDICKGQVDTLHSKKADLEGQLVETQDEVATEVHTEIQLLQEKEQLIHNINSVIKDLENIDVTIEQSRKARELNSHTIEDLDKKISRQVELVNEIEKEVHEKGAEDVELVQKLKAAKTKLTELNLEKSSNQQTLTAIEDSLNEELKLRSNTESAKYKAEQDLNKVEIGVTEHDTIIKKLEGTLKDEIKQITSVASKLSDDEGLVAKLQKQIKELQARIDQLEESVEA